MVDTKVDTGSTEVTTNAEPGIVVVMVEPCRVIVERSKLVVVLAGICEVIVVVAPERVSVLSTVEAGN